MQCSINDGSQGLISSEEQAIHVFFVANMGDYLEQLSGQLLLTAGRV